MRRLESVRFRARTRVHAREQILAQVATWLDDYRALEAALDANLPPIIDDPASQGHRDPRAFVSGPTELAAPTVLLADADVLWGNTEHAQSILVPPPTA